MESRRDALKKMAAAVAAGSAVAAASPGLAASPSNPAQDAPEPQAPPRAAPWPLLAPLTVGDVVGEWTIAGLGPVEQGAVVLELSRGDQLARVHLCRKAGRPCGLASTERFDLVLMNFGDGNTPSPEQLARTLAVLASRLDANADLALQACPELSELMPHGERLAAFFGSGQEVLV